MIGGIVFYWRQISNEEKTQVKNYSAELFLLFTFGFLK
jgi:hypothetical protein